MIEGINRDRCDIKAVLFSLLDSQNGYQVSRHSVNDIPAILQNPRLQKFAFHICQGCKTVDVTNHISLNSYAVQAHARQDYPLFPHPK
jgi:hypothetical protein